MAQAAAGAGDVEAAALQQQLAGLSLTPDSNSSHQAATDTGGATTSSSSSRLIAGLEVPLSMLRELVGWPVQHAAAAAELGVSWPRGVLLHGPPGCGKSLLVKAVAGERGQGTGLGVCGCTAGAAGCRQARPSSQAVSRPLHVGEALTRASQHCCLVQAVTMLAALLLPLAPACLPACPEEFGASLHSITPGSVFGAYLGESERRLRDSFEAAAAQAAAGQLAMVFLDEVDALCPRRGPGGSSRSSGNQHEARVVAQLLTLLDGAAALEDAAPPAVGGGGGAAAGAVGSAGRRAAGRLVVVAATNRPNALDPALRRPGRLDREVAVSVPDAGQRADILRWVGGC